MPYCGECKEECKVIIQDQGIGSYECHGFCGNQSVMVAVSDCCEADVFEDEECKIPYAESD